MSTIKTKNIQHPSAAEPALTLNPDGTFNAALGDVEAQSLNGSTFSFRNKLINGNFDIWQRGTTFSGSVFTADRWKINSDGGASNRVFGPDGIANYALQVANPASYMGQFIELPSTGRAGEFQLGTTWTLSWYQNNTSPALTYMQFRDSDNESGGTNIMYLGNGTAVETVNGWTRYKVTMTFTEAPVSTSTCLTCFLGASGEANTQYTGVQFEKGGLTVLEQRPIGVELSLCQRYFWASKTTLVATAVGSPGPSTFCIVQGNFPTTMRITPTQSYTVADMSIVNEAYCSPDGYYVIGGPQGSSGSAGVLTNYTADAEF